MIVYNCNCGWSGTDLEPAQTPTESCNHISEFYCPKCGNMDLEEEDEFDGAYFDELEGRWITP